MRNEGTLLACDNLRLHDVFVCVSLIYPCSFNMMMMRVVGSVFFYDAILQPQFGNSTM